MVFRARVINQFIAMFTEDSGFIKEDTVTCQQAVIKNIQRKSSLHDAGNILARFYVLHKD